MKNSLTVWRLRAKADRRFRSGHPWVYSNELQESPKGIELGHPIELQDAGGTFLARGYGNPNSLIAFRALSRDPGNLAPHSPDSVFQTLNAAARLRANLGLNLFSHRLCFGEGDGLPGLVIDRFVVNDSPFAQVFVVQIHTAGMDQLKEDMVSILKRIVDEQNQIPWERTAIVLRNDLSVRKLEGIAIEEPKLIREIAGLALAATRIRVRAAGGSGNDAVVFQVDLSTGQKTGFFLDQAANIELAAQRFGAIRPAHGSALRILDLCCYVGQWGTQLARVFKTKEVDTEVVAVDASAKALELAKLNVESVGARCEILKADVLKDLQNLPSGSFDIVICDPPALIKGRKDIPAGTHAYLNLNTQAIRLAKTGGAIISCSCSALLEEDEFTRVLSKAAYRNRAQVQWIARGCQGPDHPMLLEFPEGRYLKCWLGQV